MQEILSTVVPTTITANIIGTLYSKLIINSCINTLGAVCGLYLGKMLAVKKIRRVFIEIIREAVAVAVAAGIKVEVYDGKLDFYALAKKSKFNVFKTHLLIRIVGFKYRRLKSSTLQSLERGKLSEVRSLNGYIVEKGQHNKVPTPVNSKLVEIVEEIESGIRKIELANFEDPFFAQFQ